MPKESDAEREARASALRSAMLEAARVPMRIAVVAAEVLEMAERIAPIGNRNAASDAGVAAQLAAAGLRGALLNVRINLPYLAGGRAAAHFGRRTRSSASMRSPPSTSGLRLGAVDETLARA